MIGRRQRRSGADGIHLGIDAGQRRLKVVALSGAAGGLVVHQAVDLSIASFGADLQELGRQVVRSLDPSIASAVASTAVDAGDSFAQRRTFAVGGETAALADFVARSPFRSGVGSPDAVRSGYAPVGRPVDGRVDVVAAVARERGVVVAEDLVRAAGLEPGPVTVASVALANAWEASGGGARMLVHVGFGAALILALDDSGLVEAHHSMSGGVEHLSEQVRQSGVDVSVEVLEEEMLLPDSRAVPGTVFERWVQGLVQDVRRVRGSVERQGFAVPEGLSISGGATRIPGFAARLAELLAVEVGVFDPFRGLQWAQGSVASARPAWSPALALAFGLAAGSIDAAVQR